MSSILDILGVISEKIHFSITVHRFRDSLDFLEYRSGILKPQNLDKVLSCDLQLFESLSP
jgi:hypothetical protein